MTKRVMFPPFNEKEMKMSLSKQLEKYPREFLELAERFNSQTVIRLPTGGRKEAMRLRFKLYGFKRALTLAGMDSAFFNFLASEMVIDASGNLLIRLPEASDGVEAVKLALQGMEQSASNPQPAPDLPTTRMVSDEVSPAESAVEDFLRADRTPPE